MKNSIEVLEKEKKQLTDCLSGWDLNNYPEARKERQKKLNDLDECINILKCVENGINPFSEAASVFCVNLKSVASLTP